MKTNERQLISINIKEENGKQTVSARELHEKLEVSTQFKDWIRRMIEYGFEEGKDYCSFMSESTGGRPAVEYYISIDMAKEICMIQRTDKGRQFRQYFIECERRLIETNKKAMPQTYIEAVENLNVSGVYKILCLVNGKFYIGSSKNIKQRWYTHRAPSAWRKYPNRALYQDTQKYGVDKFRIQLLATVMGEHLKQVEQEFIEMLKPTYNSNNACGNNVERQKETERKCGKKYRQEHKEYLKNYHDGYSHQLCSYNGETLTLKALLRRFQRMKIPHATIEAKKYLINTTQM